MKPVILFVDDEPNILSGLRRSLLKYRRDWDMHFVESGEAGLSVMKEHDVDIIISDMRMPYMDGVEFLQKAKELKPATVRIILSGHADKEALISAAGVSHRYLAKPCEQKILVNTILKSVELMESYKKSKVHDVLLSIHSLPSPKAIWHSLEEELQSNSISVNKVSDIITSDVSLSAKVLQLANNAYYSTPMRVYSAKEAINILGIDIIGSLALNAGIIDIDDDCLASADKSILKQKILCQSIVSARLAREFCKDLDFTHDEVERVSTISMLNNIGKLFLIGAYEDDYMRCFEMVEKEGTQMFEAEERVFGATHNQIGAYLMSLWGLPEDISNAILKHHSSQYLSGDVELLKAIPYIVVCFVEKHIDNGVVKDFLAKISFNLKQISKV
jgi:HD-like signal output (HDOD) protein/CheY-like chemotaxis protein